MGTASANRELTVDQPHARARGRAVMTGSVVVALASGVLIGRSTAPVERPEGLAPPAVSSILQHRVSAVNGDAGQSQTDIGAFYGRRAVLEEQDQHPHVVSRGRDDIASRLYTLRAMAGFSINDRAQAIQVGPYVAEGLGWTGGEGIAVYQFDAEDRIVHQWVIGGRR